MSAAARPWFVRGDLDGAVGLFIDNLVQLLLIVQLAGLCGIVPGEPSGRLLTDFLLPGAAVGLLVGNAFYWWQARRLMRRTGRDDVTALPYGINTPSLLLFVFFVMVPAYETGVDRLGPAAAARQAWQCGLVACLGSGLIELLGAAVARPLRRATPRAALLGTLAGIAVSFIAMTFFVQAYQSPLVALLPVGIVFLTYFSRQRFPVGLPGGVVALAVGTAIAWAASLLAPGWLGGDPLTAAAVGEAAGELTLTWSRLAVGPLGEILAEPAVWLPYVPVIVMMGLFNVVGSLQNVESAAVEGDEFAAGPSLAANGLGTLLSACFGGCFPTTIYIGHPGWKQIGARAGYSLANGLAIAAVCCLGAVVLISRVVPIEAGLGIVIWIGVAIIAQAFTAVPPRHAIAVALGLLPAIAAWGATVVIGAFTVAGGATLQDALAATASPDGRPGTLAVSGFAVHGLLALERGYIFTSLIVAATVVCLVDRRLLAAAGWMLAAAALTGLGAMHAYQLRGNVLDYALAGVSTAGGGTRYSAVTLVVAYGALAMLFAAFGWRGQSRGRQPDAGHPPAHSKGPKEH